MQAGTRVMCDRALRFLLVLGCLATATTGARADTVTTWRDLRDARVVKQNLDYSCGAASVATILREFYALDVAEADVLDALGLADGRYSFADLAEAVGRWGLKGGGLALSFEQLKKLSVPVVAYMKHRGQDHFSVVRGVSGRDRPPCRPLARQPPAQGAPVPRRMGDAGRGRGRGRDPADRARGRGRRPDRPHLLRSACRLARRDADPFAQSPLQSFPELPMINHGSRTVPKSRTTILAFTLALAWAAPAAAEPSAAARAYVEAAGFTAAVSNVVPSIVAQEAYGLSQGVPDADPEAVDVYLAHFEEELRQRLPALEEQVAEMVDEAFSQNELRELIAFFETELGAKFVAENVKAQEKLFALTEAWATSSAAEAAARAQERLAQEGMSL